MKENEKIEKINKIEDRLFILSIIKDDYLKQMKDLEKNGSVKEYINITNEQNVKHYIELERKNSYLYSYIDQLENQLNYLKDKQKVK